MSEELVLFPLTSERGGRGEFIVRYDFFYRGTFIKADFITDLCSSPWWGSWMVPISGRSTKPAIRHDWNMERTSMPYWSCHLNLYRDLRCEGFSRCCAAGAAFGAFAKYPFRRTSK